MSRSSRKSSSAAPDLLAVYNTLLVHYGHRGWWPGKTVIEIIVGAILTQNTSWKNVERAIANLKERKMLSARALIRVDEKELADAVRPSGYYNIKARRLKSFMDFLARRYRGSPAAMFRQPLDRLREEILSVNGVGPETADSILLYAGGLPVFVVDLYTYRVVTRHGWLPEGVDYEGMQQWFASRLPEDVDLYNDFHAQFVAVGNEFCRAKPRCEGCPLAGYLLCGVAST
ncbi:MAG: endonuclease III domain-containing protein [bacterium]